MSKGSIGIPQPVVVGATQKMGATTKVVEKHTMVEVFNLDGDVQSLIESYDNVIKLVEESDEGNVALKGLRVYEKKDKTKMLEFEIPSGLVNNLNPSWTKIGSEKPCYWSKDSAYGKEIGYGQGAWKSVGHKWLTLVAKARGHKNLNAVSFDSETKGLGIPTWQLMTVAWILSQ